MDNNITINKLLDAKKITKEEYRILFCSKDNWFTINADREQDWNISEKEQSLFSAALSKVLKLQETADTYDCSYIIFPIFNYKNYADITSKNIIFIDAIFMGETNFAYAEFKGRANFPSVKFTKKANFYGVKFNHDVNFMSTIFYEEANFNSVQFSKNHTIFVGAIFISGAIFQQASFSGTTDFSLATSTGKVNFRFTNFLKDVDFSNAYFASEIDFNSANFIELSNFSNLSFKKINLENTQFDKINFLYISGIKASCKLQNKFIQHSQIENHEEYMESLAEINTTKTENKEPLKKQHFENKETARLIKTHFEKQNNITESNKYFAIEQEKCLEDLNKNNSLEPNKNHTRFVLYLNKYISYFGTDWVRPLLVMFIFSFFATFFYVLSSTSNDFQTANIFLGIKQNSDLLFWNVGGFVIGLLLYLTYHFKERTLLILTLIMYLLVMIFSDEARAISNDISKLINPFNIFKSKDYFEHMAPYSLFLKAIVATLIYQFIVAFRQNTRRK